MTRDDYRLTILRNANGELSPESVKALLRRCGYVPSGQDDDGSTRWTHGETGRVLVTPSTSMPTVPKPTSD